MNLLHPLFACAIYLVAFASAWLLQRRWKLIPNTSHFESIDGLRGLLALGVFIHHAVIWYQYIHTDEWAPPKSNLYNQFGKTGVSIFFMITAFLFVNKLLQNRESEFDWKDFFRSRCFRLIPMYFVSLGIMVILVFWATGWQLQVSFNEFADSMIRWLSFTIIPKSTINAFESTSIVNSGVVWSLPYEWMFYFCLPIIALLILKKRPPLACLLIAVAFIAFFFSFHEPDVHHFLSFAGGAIAPVILYYAKRKLNMDSLVFSVIVIGCLCGLCFFSSPDNWVAKGLLIIAFTCIALGNSIFGLLKSASLKFLGEISYSTYLLHGMVLFVTFYLVLGFRTTESLSPTMYGLLILLLTPVLVIVSLLGFAGVEKPMMKWGKRVRSKKSVK